MNKGDDHQTEKRPPSQDQVQPTVHQNVHHQQHAASTYPVPSYQHNSNVPATTPITNMNGVIYTQPNTVEYMLGYRTQVPTSKKSVVEAYLLCIIFGLLGAHHFYLRRPGFGCLYLFSFGLLGCGYVFDLFRMPCLVSKANRRIQDPVLEDEKQLDDAYILWFPFGLLGLHHFYLRQPGQGVFYMCTFGLLGIGWIVDAFRMPYMVEAYNKKTQEERKKKSACTAYAFGLSPFGVFGVHHFYLDRMLFGLLYFFTFGLLGIGWIVDWFRIHILTKRANEARKGINLNRKYLDDAYVLAFPLGFTGLHHFYLGRHGWGLIYFFTFGILGLGWLVDLIRLPWLVEEYNRNKGNDRMAVHVVANGNTPLASQLHGHSTVVVTGGMSNPGYVISAPPPYQQAPYGSIYPGQQPPMYSGVPGAMPPTENAAVPPPAYTPNDNGMAGPLPPKQ